MASQSPASLGSHAACGFDATVCLADPTPQLGASPPASDDRQADDRALVAAARREAQHLSRARTSKRQLPRHTISQLADTVLSSEDGQPTFGQKLGQLLRCEGGRVRLPMRLLVPPSP